jgi:hypothetical protein
MKIYNKMYTYLINVSNKYINSLASSSLGLNIHIIISKQGLVKKI